MEKTFFTSVALMAISGVTFLAYKHPVGYKRKFFPQLLLGLCIAMGALSVWDFAGASTLSKLSQFVRPDKVEEAKKVVQSSTILSAKSLIVFGGITFYLAFLLFLPDLVDHGDDKKPE